MPVIILITVDVSFYIFQNNLGKGAIMIPS